MAFPVIMPRQGQSVESCVISRWHKHKGDKVSKGELLFSYETDKASFEEEAGAEGVLLDVFFEEGDDVPVLTTVCIIGNEGEASLPREEAAAPQEEVEPARKEVRPLQAEAAAAPSAAVGAPEFKQPIISEGAERFAISPRARKLAERLGADYRLAAGTGPGGRIIEKDIEQLYMSGNLATAAAKASAAEAVGAIQGSGLGGRVTTGDLIRRNTDAVPGIRQELNTAGGGQEGPQHDYEEIALTNIRKLIAKAMQNSLAGTAQLTLNSSFDATDILALRRKVKAGGDALGLEDITLNDMLLFALSRVLMRHRELNAHLLDDKMLLFNSVNLGAAVDTDRGLMVPVIRNADSKSLNVISREAKELFQQCRKGSVNPDMLKGGSFTVTNLGTLGIESFTPILNPPQTGILGVGCIVQRVREEAGKPAYYPSMGLSLTFDHRALDGAPAARFLKELCTALENFSLLMFR